MKENPVVYELLEIKNRKMTAVRTNTWNFGLTTVE